MSLKQPKSLLAKVARKLEPIIPTGLFANLGQWHSRYIHDPDFVIFKWLAHVPGLVLDVGANRGHSALSILRQTNQVRVFSVEPNPQHKLDLLLIKLLHPFRFKFQLVGAGNKVGQETLYVPGGIKSKFSTRASLDPGEFKNDHTRAQFSDEGIDSKDPGSFHKVETNVVPLDKFHLSPDLIKVDVEGYELQTLQGLKETITDHLPALLIEANHPQRWLHLVLEHGYNTYYFNHSKDVLEPLEGFDGIVNIICLHPDCKTTLTELLLDNVE